MINEVIGGFKFPIGFFGAFFIPGGRAVLGGRHGRAERVGREHCAGLVGPQRQGGRRVRQSGLIKMLIPICIAAGLVLALLLVGKVPLRYNLRNLTVRWKTTLMTALAFTMVIALMTVMLAFVNGMYLLTENSGNPGNVVILSEGATDEALSNLPAIDLSDLENQPGILRENGRPLASRETYMIVNLPLPGARPGGPRAVLAGSLD